MQENPLLSLRFLSRQHLIQTSPLQHPQWLTVIKRLTQLIKVSLPMPARSGQQIWAAAPPASTPPTSPAPPATCRWRSPRPASPRTSRCPSPRRSCARGSGSSRSTGGWGLLQHIPAPSHSVTKAGVLSSHFRNVLYCSAIGIFWFFLVSQTEAAIRSSLPLWLSAR